MKVNWITRPNNLAGNALGYDTMVRKLLEHSKGLLEHDESSPIALQLCPAEFFEPIPGKFNVLFTMWESYLIPSVYKLALMNADAVITPSRFCRDVFAPYCKQRPEVNWLGVDCNKYKYFERKDPFVEKKPFRFLWVGAPNPRKGYPFIVEAVKIFEKIQGIEIYVKTTADSVDWNLISQKREEHKDDPDRLVAYDKMLENKEKQISYGRFGKHENIIYDMRKLHPLELVDLYHSAHCFLLPNLGEGWGLTLSEAMATGAPCIATGKTGEMDFFNDGVGYTLKTDIKDLELANYHLTSRAHIPDTHDVINKMLHVMKHYKEALRKGRKASTRIRENFTWEKSAKRLTEILKGYENEISKIHFNTAAAVV